MNLLCRSLSESSSMVDKHETTMAWLGGWQVQKKMTNAGMNNTQNMSSGFLVPDRHRVRRSSSKDVEEAMAGGLGKVRKTIFNIFNIFSNISGRHVSSTHVG